MPITSRKPKPARNAESTARLQSVAAEMTAALRHAPQTVLELFEQSATLVTGTATDAVFGKVFHLYGNALHKLTRYADALNAFTKAVAIYEQYQSNEKALVLDSLANTCIKLSRYDEAREGLEAAMKLAKKNKDDALVARVLLGFALLHHALAEFQTALTFTNQSLEIRRRLELRDGIATCLMNRGMFYYMLGLEAKAIEDTHQALKIFQDLGSEEPQSICLINLGSFYNQLQEYDKAIAFTKESLAIRQRIGDRRGEIVSLTNLGDFSIEISDLKAAETYYFAAKKVADAYNHPRGVAIAEMGLGMLYTQQRKFVKAREHYQHSYTTIHEHKVYENLGVLLDRFAQCEIESKNYDAAKRLLLEQLKFTEKYQTPQFQPELYRKLGVIAEKSGNLSEALEHQRTYHEKYVKQLGAETRNKIKQLEVVYETERLEKEKEILSLQNKQLAEQLSFKTRELTTLAMHLVEKNELLDKLCGEIEHAADMPEPEAKSAYRNLIGKMKHGANSEKDWKTFETQFNMVFPNFVKALSEKYPRLTPAELRVASLLKMNMATKEIARLLSVSTRNVESHRYSIRKKIKLRASHNLSSFLAGL
jgi:tetratricopeptide (TPR) repeat protein/DNA-binding CsgD family transcriptional regulator